MVLRLGGVYRFSAAYSGAALYMDMAQDGSVASIMAEALAGANLVGHSTGNVKMGLAMYNRAHKCKSLLNSSIDLDRGGFV